MMTFSKDRLKGHTRQPPLPNVAENITRRYKQGVIPTTAHVVFCAFKPLAVLYKADLWVQGEKRKTTNRPTTTTSRLLGYRLL